MQFLYPYFLWALGLVAVPIVVHLFHFRRFRTVYFTNVRFLREVKEETSNRRKIRNLLVLLMRCLAVVALVLAFAQPFIPLNDAPKRGDNALSIFIDNSFSMAAEAQAANLLEQAKQKAREIVAAYSSEDKFQVLTNDFEGKHQRLVSKDEALTLIDEVRVTPSVRPLSQVLFRQKQVLNTGKTAHKTAFIVSDFQKNVADFAAFKDTTVQVKLLPLTAVQQRNISIDSAWFDAPVQMVGQTNPLVVKITNHADEAVDNVKLSLWLNGEEKPVGLLNLKAKASVTDTVNIAVLKTGWQEAKLSVTDYPIQFDDHFYFAFNVPKNIPTLIINEGNSNRLVEKGLSVAPIIQVTNMNNSSLQYTQFPNFQMIVLNELVNISSGLSAELKQFMSNGGNVLVFPATNANMASYNDFFNSLQANTLNASDNVAREVGSINTDAFVFQDVFTNKNANLRLPATKMNFKMANRSGETLLNYRDGSTFMAKNDVGSGHIYICAAPVDAKVSNFAQNGEIFVPMLYKIAVSGTKSTRIAYTIGVDDWVEADSKGFVGEKGYKMKGQKEEFIPEQRLTAGKVLLGIKEGVKEAGTYQLFARPDSILYKYGFNFDRRESDLAYFSASELKDMAQKPVSVIDAIAEANMTAVIDEQNQGIGLWRWCIWAVLLFLAAETALLRFWKV